MGGSITVDDSGRIDGDVDAIGGTLNRAKGAEIHGDVKVDQRRRGQSDGQGPSTVSRLAEEAGNAITLTALLFVFGAILISFTSERMEKLRAELAARPMRSIAAGIVAVVTAVAVFVALCVTIVGIPFALIGLFMAFVAVAAGLSSALETLGGALLAHRTRNPYAHLALGCALFLVLGAIPFVGSFVKGAAVLAGIGTVALTRGAGLFSKNRPSGSPYREAPVG
jgi:hypothetical protein